MKNIEKDLAMADILYKTLHDELSEDEKVMLECWLEDEENRKFYLSLQEPESLFEDVLEMTELDTPSYYHKTLKQINRKRRLRTLLLLTTVAAVLLPAIWIVWPLLHPQPGRDPVPYQLVQQTGRDQTRLETGEGKVYYLADSIKQLETRKTEVSQEAGKTPEATAPTEDNLYNVLATSSRGTIQVTLSDSTRVWLNADSRLRYPHQFKSGKREVEITGEAYFEVAHDIQKPFVVKAGTTHIEVLGTQFNVKTKTENACVTTLIAGCVKMRNKTNDTVVIHPGQQVEVSQQGMMKVASVDPRFAIAWKRNRFAFQEEPLYRIMEELAEWYDESFEFAHPRLANLHFTTIMPRYDSIDEVLGILQATQEFGFVRTDHHIRIVFHDNNRKTN